MNSRPHAFFSVAIATALLIALASSLSSQPATAPSLSLLSRDGRRALPLTPIADQEFVALDDLANAFQLTVREESLGAVTVSYKGKTIVLTPDQALASVAGRLVSLPAPPSRNGRRWLVPVEFISRALSLIYDTRLELRKPSHLLVIGDLRVPRIAVRYDPLGVAGRLTIDATPRANATVSQDAEHLTIKFDADALDVPNPPLASSAAPGLLLAVRIVDATTLAVDLGPRFAGFRATSQPVDTTMRLVIDIVSAQTDAAAAGANPAAPPAAPATPAELPPSFGQTGSTFRTIAIDPGHGGDDEGAKSAEGAKEKDLTLALARRVKGVIEARLGLRVLLTRDDDRSVPVDERTASANNNKADLFVSLHASASMRPAAAGASIFVAAFDRDSAQAATGGAERLPAFGGGSREIELVPWDLAQTRHLDQSAAFAELLQQSLKDHVPLAARPVDRAPMRVLESANMPAVLVEVGYLTNPEQAKLIAGDAFQNAIVQALFDAIVKFRDTLPGGGDALMGRTVAIAGTLAIVVLFAATIVVVKRGVPAFGQRPAARPAAAVAPAPLPAPPGRKIKARLFYIAEDGARLASIERDVAYGEGPDDQAREIIAAQIAPVAEPLVSAIPPGTTLRAVFITRNGDAYVDLSREARAAHPGGTVNELLTVYTIVNALTVNLPAVTAVQVLVDGKEVDTLAGHVDLRRPLAKNLAWIQ